MNRYLQQITITMTAVLALSTSALAAEGTVTADSSLRLRAEANTSSAIMANMPANASVEVLAITESGWYQVNYNGNEGFASGEYLTVADTSSLPLIKDPVYGVINDGPLNVRTGPSTEDSVSTIFAAGTVLVVLDDSNPEWYQIEEGYVSAQYIDIITAEEASVLREAAAKSGSAVVDYAMQFLGYRYVYGGSTPSGFDCSGFTQYVYKNFGVTLNRSSRDQVYNGTAVSRSELLPGDLVLFAKGGSTITHVGLYIGNNQFIHASTSTTGVIISDMDSAYYTTGFVCGRRIL
ncbi:MAG: NlpC/P60 family protein [Eubacteriales bacterium]